MFRITVINADQHEELQHHGGPIELGRAPSSDGAVFTIQDHYISRRQMVLQEIGPGRIQLQNLGADMVLQDGTTVSRGDSHVLILPTRIIRGHTRIELSADMRSDTMLHTISEPVSRGRGLGTLGSLDAIGRSPQPEQLARWFETLLSVQKSAAGSREFFQETAQAVVDLVGMDRGMVILREQEQWQVVASYAPGKFAANEFSRTVLDHVREQKRTYYEAVPDSNLAISLAAVDSYVASPIFGHNDEVIGVVFGSRNQREDAPMGGIQPLEAQVVQLLASAVSAGMARVDQEAEAARLHVQLQQFASPELVRELQRQPNLLDPTDREISVLFGDLRGFTQICEMLSPRETYQLVSDVMERLTQCIAEHGGFVIDYSGDGIGAMWNAPTHQDDHARRACHAALAMQAQMPELSAHWEGRVGRPLRLGVGINTDIAQVGNAGSQRRFKYSPLGHAVNLASRVEGATKQLGVSSLITASTHEQVASALATRRLCQVRVLGVQQPVSLFELRSAAEGDHERRMVQAYEEALAHYERRQPAETVRILEGWIKANPANPDEPINRLLAQAQADAANPGYDPVWNLDRK